MNESTTFIGTSIEQAVYYLQIGETVAIPTETVYGLAANAFSEVAIEKVFRIKQRPSSNPLIVHTGSKEELKQLVTAFPDVAGALLDKFSPGPLTVLLPKKSILSGTVTAGSPLAAFRIPAHPVALALLQQTGFPLVAPSANLYTTISPTTAQHVLKNLGGRLPYILDGGRCTVGIESTVVGFDEAETPVVYRQGAITPEQIKAVAGAVRFHTADAVALSPGMAKLHYSPRTPLFLIQEGQLPAGIDAERTGILCFRKRCPILPDRQQFVLSESSDLAEVARNIYAGLHYLDELGLDVLLAERCPATGIGVAINDRLERAAFKRNNEGGLAGSDQA
jgi:L-threonylcarbamoyladenylate synthase